MFLAATTESFHTAARLMDFGGRGAVSRSCPVLIRTAAALLPPGRVGKAAVLRGL